MESLKQLQDENKFLREQLWRIANPIAAMQKDAEAEGVKIDGHAAVSLANSVHNLTRTAQRALDKLDGDTLQPFTPSRTEYDKCTSTKHNSICLLRAGDEEPIFVLRAKDPTAPEVVNYWITLNAAPAYIQPEEKLIGASKLSDEMVQWYKDNKETAK